MKRLHMKKMSSFQVIIFGFLTVILAGTLLLMIPAASADGRSASFGTSLFTATSAVCVTGLVVRDTATGWSVFGQAVILSLIQIGGMGVVLIATGLAMLSGRRISLMQRSRMQDAMSAPQVGGIVRLTRFILRFLLAAELLGALLMLPSFAGKFGIGRGIWYSVFHSVSAFCNAGFDLMGVTKPYSSLTGFVGNPVINITIMLLIISGGLGFLTWEDILHWKWRVRRYRLQSKIILAVTLLLIVLPAIYFYFGEYGQMKGGTRVLASFFQSVTTRTAGFNTTDIGSLSETGKALMILLMLIGGAPGSTAGGMKVTTFGVLMMTAVAVMARKSETGCFGRRIETETIRYAVSICAMYIVLFLAGGLIISRLDGFPLIDCLFETASAIGTVGLTAGLTTKVSAFSKAILIVLMYIGRVGGLTLIFATIPGTRKANAKFVSEKVTVG